MLLTLVGCFRRFERFRRQRVIAGETHPSRSIHTGRANPYHIALNRAETRLYNADPSQGAVTIYDFATGAQVNKIAKGLAVALDPVQIPGE